MLSEKEVGNLVVNVGCRFCCGKEPCLVKFKWRPTAQSPRGSHWSHWELSPALLGGDESRSVGLCLTSDLQPP